MTGFYDRAEKTAQKLLFKFGQKSTIRRGLPGVSDDPWNPTEGSVETVTVDAVVTEYNQMERASSLIEVNDKKVLVSTRGLTFVPTADMVFIDAASDEYTIIRVSPLRPGPKTLMYELQVRR